MTPYEQRIPVADPYALALGRVMYNFAVTQWSVVYLGMLLDEAFPSTRDVDDLGSASRDFKLLADAEKSPDFVAIANKFSALTTRYLNLLHTTGFTAADKEQLLGSSDAGNIDWTLESVDDLASDLQSLDLEATSLYREHKASNNS